MSCFRKHWIIWSMLALFGAQVSSTGLANDRLKREYHKAAKKRDAVKLRKLKKVQDQLAKAAEKPRQEYLARLEKKHPGLHAELKKEAQGIMRMRASANEKAKLMKELLKRHERVLRSALNSRSPLLRQFRRDAQMILRAFKCTFDAFFNILCSDNEEPDISIPEDISFTARYSDTEEVLSGALIGIGEADANEFNGNVRTKALAVDAGISFTKAGMVEVVEVPPSVDRVKVTVHTDIDFEIISFAIFGISGGYADTYLSVWGDNTFKCNESRTLASAFAPLLFVMGASGNMNSTITCEFTPDSDGGQYVIASGVESSVSAVLPAATISKMNGPVEEMQVQFILE